MDVVKKKRKNRPNPNGKGMVTRDRLRTKAPELKKLIFQSRFVPYDIDSPTSLQEALADIKQHSAIEKLLFFGDEVPAVSEEQIFDFCYDCVAKGKEELVRRLNEAGGRRTTYKPWVHIPMVLNRMSRGCSQTELALEMGVMPYMIYRWKNQFTSFCQALEEGHKLSEAWWLKVGRANLTNPKFNNNLYANQLATRFGHSAKKIQVDHTGTVNVSGSIDHNHRHVILSLRQRLQQLPIKELERLTDILALEAPSEIDIVPEDYVEVDFEAYVEESETVEDVGE